MARKLTHTLILIVVLALFLSCLSIPAFSTNSSCDGCTFGTFNGSPACLKDGALHICAQNFPDDNFRDYISKEFDPNGVGSLSQAAVDAVEEIRCGDWDSDSSLGIKDLSGIQYFTSITVLHCANNELTYLDLSKNTALIDLDCQANQLTELLLNNLPELYSVICGGNKISTLTLPYSYFDTLYIGSNALAYLPTLGVAPYNFGVGNQVIYRELDVQPKEDGYTIDLAQIIDDELWLTMLDSVDGGTFDRATNTVYFQNFPETFTYTLKHWYNWDSGFTGYLGKFDVTVNVLCAHKWSSADSNPVTCTVCGALAPGKIENTTANNDYSGALLGEAEELANKLFTEAELSKLEQGENINFNLTVKDITSTVSPETANVFTQALGDYTPGAYLDISLFKQVGSSEPEAISATNGAVTISLSIPSELHGTDRAYKILRLHNGSIAELDVNYDKKSETLTFQSDAFSTYALVYRDTVTAPGDTTNPETGDRSLSSHLLITAFCICSIAVVWTNFARRRVK